MSHAYNITTEFYLVTMSTNYVIGEFISEWEKVFYKVFTIRRVHWVSLVENNYLIGVSYVSGCVFSVPSVMSNSL